MGLADGLKVYDMLNCGSVPRKIQTLVTDARDKGTIKVNGTRTFVPIKRFICI